MTFSPDPEPATDSRDLDLEESSDPVMVHFHVTVEEFEELPAVVSGDDAILVITVRDASTITFLAAMADRLYAHVAPGLVCDENYPPQLMARDIATLSQIMEIHHVVLEGESAVEDAAVIRALLVDEEVDFANARATVRGAFNRPAPPHPITIWTMPEWRGSSSRLSSPGLADLRGAGFGSLRYWFLSDHGDEDSRQITWERLGLTPR